MKNEDKEISGGFLHLNKVIPDVCGSHVRRKSIILLEFTAEEGIHVSRRQNKQTMIGQHLCYRQFQISMCFFLSRPLTLSLSKKE